jgi:hypothetical protein
MLPASKKFLIKISTLKITAQPHFFWCGHEEVLSQFQHKIYFFPRALS